MSDPVDTNEAIGVPRSPLLLSRAEAALVVVDVQDKLLKAIPRSDRLVWNIRRLIDGATVLGVPVIATEQYPQGLGSTNSQLAERLTIVHEKRSFSCARCTAVDEFLRNLNVRQVLLCGIESHVCVLQTAMDLLTAGYEVYLAVDAIRSRRRHDQRVAIRRMDSSGVTLTTVESALFEWCETSEASEFKQISQLVREEPQPPAQ